MARKSSTAMPQARTEGLSITVSGSETLVYDRELYVIHRLGPEAAAVWNLADGTRDNSQLATEASAELARSVSASAVEGILQELSSMGLVQSEALKKSGLSRRMLVGSALGTAAAGTMISSASASPVLCGGEPMPPNAPTVCGWFGLVPGCVFDVWFCVPSWLGRSAASAGVGQMPYGEAEARYNQEQTEKSQVEEAPAAEEPALDTFVEESSEEFEVSAPEGGSDVIVEMDGN